MPRTVRTELDERGQRFCVEVAKGVHRIQAGLNAGYTEKTARCKSAGWLKQAIYINEINRLRGIVGEVVDVQCKPDPPKLKPKAKRVPILPEELPPTSRADIDAEMRAHAESIAAAAKAVNLSKEWVLEGLIANYKRATECEKPNLPAANQALNLIGIQLGMFVRRQHIEYEDVTKLTPEETRAEMEKALAEIGDQVPETIKALLMSHAGTMQ